MEPEQTNLKDVTLRFLSETTNITASLGTVSSEGAPHSAIVYFSIDENLHFYFLTAVDTQKYKNLLANPKASLALGSGPEYVTVQAQGQTALLEKGSEEEKIAIATIKKRLVENQQTWPIFQLSDYESEAVAVFKFTPSVLYFLNLDKNNGLPVTTEGLQQVI